MPAPLVIDASAAIKWLLHEPGREAAVAIQDAYMEGRIDLIAPQLIMPEIANVLWKRHQRGEFDTGTALHLFRGFLRDSPILIDSLTVHERAIELALEYNRSAYDCEYLALALDEGCDLITADRRFYRALRPRFSCLRLLPE